MIQLYTFTTPNGRKISIFLEEAELPYNVHVVNLRKGEQHTPAFLAINPNAKIPAIIDEEGPDQKPYTLFESGAILIYLAEKTGKFLPSSPRLRYEAIQWLMFQMAGVGPMFGQAGYFVRFASEKIPHAIERYTKEVKRLLGVLDQRLSDREFLADEYSIADMATYPWIKGGVEILEMSSEVPPNVRRWLETVGKRPAVERGMQVPKLA